MTFFYQRFDLKTPLNKFLTQEVHSFVFTIALLKINCLYLQINFKFSESINFENNYTIIILGF